MKNKLAGKKVLLVDDDERNIYALSVYLETININIITAKDGADALEKMHANHDIDLVLLDMMMPVMDGFETMVAIKKEQTLLKIPIIAVTARAMKGDREKCLEAGAWEYISKPLDMTKLIELMAKWV